MGKALFFFSIPLLFLISLSEPFTIFEKHRTVLIHAGSSSLEEQETEHTNHQKKRDITCMKGPQSASILERIETLDASKHASCYVGFVIDGQCVGQVHRDLVGMFLECRCHDQPCFRLLDNNAILLIADDRTTAMDAATDLLLKKGFITKRHGDLYPVGLHRTQPLCVVDRNAAPFFGIESIGVHLLCFVRNNEGQVSLWMAQRASTKSTFPSYWDPTVAGGQPANLSLYDNMLKEAAEEAGISPDVAKQATAVSCLSQMTSRKGGKCLKQSLYYSWELEVSAEFEPCAIDGEVAQFRLWTCQELEEEVRLGDRLRPAMRLVVTDFLIRHGAITPDGEPEYAGIQAAMHRDRLVLWKQD